MPSINLVFLNTQQKCFPSCLMFSWQNSQAVSFHRHFFGGSRATASHQLNFENAPFRMAEGGCRVGFTSILTLNSCPGDGWRLGREGKWHSSLTRPGLPAPDSSARGETRFHADFLWCLQNKQHYLKRPDWKNTPLCATSLGLSLNVLCTLHTHTRTRAPNMLSRSLNLSGN